MLTLTTNAASTIERVLASNAGAAGLRIQVEGGGCSGLKYRMGLEAAAGPDDAVIEVGGARVFVDPGSRRYLTGATVDFVEGAGGSGFRFDNPNAATGCAACGSSFGAVGCSATARH